MKTAKIFSIFFLILGVGIITPNRIYAQICPVDYNASITPALDYTPSATKTDNEEWSDLNSTEQSYSVTGPYSGRSTSWSASNKIVTNGFTKIYTNFLSILQPFNNANMVEVNEALADKPQTYANWVRSYCLGGLDDVRNGYVKMGASGSYVDEEKYKVPRQCTLFETPPCTRTRTRYPPFGNTQEGSEESTEVPYYGGLREVATKVANIARNQYCNASEDCINSNYFCDTSVYSKPKQADPASLGKTGTCVLTEEAKITVNSPTKKTVDILCTDLITPTINSSTQKISSNICIYDSDGLKVGPTSTNSYPHISEVRPAGNGLTGGATISEGKNSLPFDMELFENRNESENYNCQIGAEGCNIDGYFRRALVNKFTKLTSEDVKRLENIPAKLGNSINIGGSGKGVNDPWMFDFVEKLGTVDFWAEEARFLDPNLEPAGYGVMNAGGIKAYLRMHNADRGVLFVNGTPIGIRDVLMQNGTAAPLNSGQYKPFVSKQLNGPGYVVLTVATDPNKIHKAYISITPNGGEPMPLRELPNPGKSIVIQYEYSALMNTRGDVFVMAYVNDFYIYSIYNSSSRNFSQWQPLPINAKPFVKATIDQKDQIHVVGLPGEGSSELVYSLFNFSEPVLSINLQERSPIQNKRIQFPRGLRSVGSAPFNIQTDRKNELHIAANVQATGAKYWLENDIYYTKVDASGTQKDLQIAVSAASDYSSNYTLGPSSDSRILIGHQLAQLGTSIAVDYDPTSGIERKYIAYINYLQGRDFGEARQAAYAVWNPDRGWEQNLKLSDRIVVQMGSVRDINLDRAGNVSFTTYDRGNKYFESLKKFDASGYKQCSFDGSPNLFTIGKVLGQSTKCAYSREDIAYIIAPSNKIQGQKLTLKKDFPRLSDGVKYPKMYKEF